VSSRDVQLRVLVSGHRSRLGRRVLAVTSVLSLVASTLFVQAKPATAEAVPALPDGATSSAPVQATGSAEGRTRVVPVTESQPAGVAAVSAPAGSSSVSLLARAAQPQAVLAGTSPRHHAGLQSGDFG
jgi:hypothetical protein